MWLQLWGGGLTTWGGPQARGVPQAGGWVPQDGGGGSYRLGGSFRLSGWCFSPPPLSGFLSTRPVTLFAVIQAFRNNPLPHKQENHNPPPSLLPHSHHQHQHAVYQSCPPCDVYTVAFLRLILQFSLAALLRQQVCENECVCVRGGGGGNGS